jgi:hypothetical protein
MHAIGHNGYINLEGHRSLLGDVRLQGRAQKDRVRLRQVQPAQRISTSVRELQNHRKALRTRDTTVEAGCGASVRDLRAQSDMLKKKSRHQLFVNPARVCRRFNDLLGRSDQNLSYSRRSTHLCKRGFEKVQM